MTQKDLIDYITKRYLKEKKRITASKESEISENLHYASIIVSKIEDITSYLEEDDYFIIYNEVIKGRTGKWYQNYLSESTYYRHRKTAYDKFIKKLEK